MALMEWESTVQKIVDELAQLPKEKGRDRLLMEWRVKLEKEPTRLRPHQIDEIVREARRRGESQIADGG